MLIFQIWRYNILPNKQKWAVRSYIGSRYEGTTEKPVQMGGPHFGIMRPFF